MMVKDFMTSNVMVASEENTVEQAAKLMVENNISALPIVNDQQELVGILTESDFVGKEIKPRHALASLRSLFGEVAHLPDVEEVYKKSRQKKLSEVMSKDPKTAQDDEALSSVVAKMHANDLKRLPVLKDGKLVGIVTRKDLIKAYANL